MKVSRLVVLSLAVFGLAGCSATRPVPPTAPQPEPSPPQPALRAQPSGQAEWTEYAAALDLVKSLTLAQVRRANGEGLPFPELTAEQQQAVRTLWAGAAARQQARVEAGRIPPTALLVPVGQVRVTQVGYVDPSWPLEPPSVRVELRGGKHSYGTSVHADALSPAAKEGAVDLVAIGMVVPLTDEDRKAMAAGEPLPPPADN